MGNLIGHLIDLVARFWEADPDIRDQSVSGESEMERRARRFVAWLYGGIVFVLCLSGFSWWWFTRNQ